MGLHFLRRFRLVVVLLNMHKIDIFAQTRPSEAAQRFHLKLRYDSEIGFQNLYIWFIFQNGNVNLDEPLPKTAAFLSTIAFNRDDIH